MARILAKVAGFHAALALKGDLVNIGTESVA
jgi:hypothetical protein